MLVGGIDAHYTSYGSLDPPSFIYVVIERMVDLKPPESWKRITCIMMIHAGHHNKEIMVVAQCSLNTVKTIRHKLENAMETTRLLLEDKSNIADDLISFVQQNSSKICRKSLGRPRNQN